MSYYDQQQVPPQAYPPPANAYPPPGQAYPPAYAAPPPAGYPMKEGVANPQPAPAQTQDRGDGFWKGCCAALCCCCVLDMCF
uniref:Cysteine-rich and transmembrane domain-containing protein WIH2 n=1 Tax=Elaeis guineensis var. tenera TaxID=51953 RepID=A0A6I9SDS7_ELAGV|nr:cysteine-rich and transmembrane domain-containing protein WIH2 [Elaeis guineensis]